MNTLLNHSFPLLLLSKTHVVLGNNLEYQDLTRSGSMTFATARQNSAFEAIEKRITSISRKKAAISPPEIVIPHAKNTRLLSKYFASWRPAFLTHSHRTFRNIYSVSQNRSLKNKITFFVFREVKYI